MFKKILIANRGEIAVRIIRACRELNIATVAVYSEADREALHTQLADEAVCIGGARARDSYLNMHNIISAAVLTGATAIHPGFGFLAENSFFASLCKECSIAFIGPEPETIDLMGNKAQALKVMKSAKVPVVPGSEGAVDTLERAQELAKTIGFPLLIKASAGGGGKGIRKVEKAEELTKAYETARAEARGAFGDDTVYMERFLVNPKHIEVQILGDSKGNVVALGERDCSMQRNNQKVLEEAPASTITEEKRNELMNLALKACRAVKYKGAGTLEFLMDDAGRFYFMEMNTRLQVEHPVTEYVTGVDIVKEQIRIEAGLPLSLKEEEVKITGHSIECRINAEDPDKNFAPCPGTIKFVHFPGGPGIRVDSGVYAGYTIPPYYDSMVAKIIAYGETRSEALSRMRRALEELVIDGIDTNVDFQLGLLNEEEFLKGTYNTGFINKRLTSNRGI